MGIVFYFTAQPWSFLVFGVHDSMGYVVQNRSWFGMLFYYQAVIRFQTGSSITHTRMATLQISYKGCYAVAAT